MFGGKITTYRKLAEQAMEKPPAFSRRCPTHTELSGGDLGDDSLPGFIARLCRERPGFEPAFLMRLARRYGSLTGEVVGDARGAADLGQPLGGGLTEREVRYLSEREWARSAEDVLWRRTKCGLHMTTAEKTRVRARLADRA